jgi:phosphodiesterase/alkaline phosphatase D-like protein
MKKFSSLALAVALGLAMSATGLAKQGGKAGAVRITDGPRVEGVGPTWAVIAWTTNTGGSSVLRYGTDANNLGQTAQAPYSDNEKSKAQNHRVRIKGLKPGTKYYFVADSGQGEGTGSEAKSPVGNFTTKAH